jgi:hypothetical protein
MLITFIFTSPNSGPLNLLFGAGNFNKIWTPCEQHEIQYTE